MVHTRDAARGSEKRRERGYTRSMHTRMDPTRTRVGAIGCFHTQEQHTFTEVRKHNPKAGPLQVVDRLSTITTRASPWKKTQSYIPPSASPFSNTRPQQSVSGPMTHAPRFCNPDAAHRRERDQQARPGLRRQGEFQVGRRRALAVQAIGSRSVTKKQRIERPARMSAPTGPEAEYAKPGAPRRELWPAARPAAYRTISSRGQLR